MLCWFLSSSIVTSRRQSAKRLAKIWGARQAFMLTLQEDELSVAVRQPWAKQLRKRAKTVTDSTEEPSRGQTNEESDSNNTVNYLSSQVAVQPNITKPFK
eukprot:1598911-Amphidinium_carterae.1